MESEIHVMLCIYSEVKKGQESVTPMNFVLESFSSYNNQHSTPYLFLHPLGLTLED